MAKKESSETEVSALPAQETPLPELQVEPPPEEGAPEPPVQEAEKPDFRAQFDALPEEDREAFLLERTAERVRRAEQSAQDRAFARMQADQTRQVQANQGLQETLKNLDTAEDDNRRAGHVQAFANYRVQQASQQWAQEALEMVKEALGVGDAEHDELTFKLHQAAGRENRVATLGDYIKHVTGERFMPKRESDAKIRAEVNAALEERLGRQREGEPAPVSVGQGQPLRHLPSIGEVDKMSIDQVRELERKGDLDKILAKRK